MPPSPPRPTRTLRDEDVVSERRLARRSAGREALERAIRREEARAPDLLELPRAETDLAMVELDSPLAAE